MNFQAKEKFETFLHLEKLLPYWLRWIDLKSVQWRLAFFKMQVYFIELKSLHVKKLLIPFFSVIDFELFEKFNAIF